MACARILTSGGSSTVLRALRPCALPYHRPRCRAVPHVWLATPGAVSQKASESEALLQQLVEGQLAELREMREMREDVRGMGSDLCAEMRDMGSDLRTDIRNIRKDLGGVKTILGSLYGTHVRAEVAKLFGQDYSRQLTASSVWDFLTLLFDGATQRPATITDHRQLVEMRRRIAAKLVEEQLPTRLLRSIHYRLEVGML